MEPEWPVRSLTVSGLSARTPTMRNYLNSLRPSQPDPRLQSRTNDSNAVARVSTSTAAQPVNNPSTRHLQHFARMTAQNIKANALLNSDNNEVPIHYKNPGEILAAIDRNIEQTAKDWGCSKQDVEAMLGSSKRFNAPVCGVTANNVMKLFLDSSQRSYSFEHGRPLSLSQLKQQLASLPADRNFILRVNDEAMGHAYVIDLPASNKPQRDAFLYQSDLGDGATRPLRLEDWMSRQAERPIPLGEVVRHFDNMTERKVDVHHLARLFDIDGNPAMLRPERLNNKNGFNFQLEEYSLKNLEKNMKAVTANCAS
ncbi:cycle-inhibiting factor [Pseudomonas gingeri]|uniref:cycle-inhibiting factor n=1 Tax=Pseudomonas gingeri TaxID=117681 RepID=UPI001C431E25